MSPLPVYKASKIEWNKVGSVPERTACCRTEGARELRLIPPGENALWDAESPPMSNDCASE